MDVEDATEPRADASRLPRRRRRAGASADEPVTLDDLIDDTSTDDDQQLLPGDDLPRRMTRAQRRRARRWAEIRRRASVVGGGLLAIGVVVALVFVVGPRIADTVARWTADEPEEVATADDGDDVVVGLRGRRTVLVATVDETTDQQVSQIQLLTVDGDDAVTAIVLVPASIVTDVPGYGLVSLADAGGVGGVPLLELAIENALDIRIDANVEMTRNSWAALFSRTDPVEVTVREAIDVPTAGGGLERRFEAGAQFLDGPRLAELLTVSVPGESEIAALPRAQDVLVGFLATLGPETDDVFGDGAPMLATDDLTVVRTVVDLLAAASLDDRLDVLTLPVAPVGAGDEVVYQIEDRGRELAEDLLGAGDQTDDGSVVDGVRLEVLNGNGRVGVGAEVAELLVPLGHQIVITGNAENFDQTETIVTVRSDEDELIAAAREIVDTLGVGRVTVSSIPSTTVDITIVVGADWTG